ncbi:MAG: hypothetical protein RMI79_03865 [Nitrososphaerota archaeon]|nr:hypothetical protein [Nitrososphaerota archaeon]
MKEKVQVIGLGTIGLPVALHISRFFETFGYDKSKDALKRASENGISTTSEIIDADVYIITVNTGINSDNQPDMSAIYEVCKKISEIKTDGLISIESTVSVGTCRNISNKFGFERLVHCPHRYWVGDPIRYGVVQTRVLGALNNKSLEKGKEFYSRLEIPLHIVPSLELAELSKIAENAYRFVQIAFAEELKMICEKVGIPFDLLREACNTKWNIQILEARDGIGGHCLPKDIRYLIHAGGGNTPLLNGAILVDINYVKSRRKIK